MRAFYLATTLGLLLLGLVAYDTNMSIRVEFEEDRIVENLSAALFFMSFCLSSYYFLSKQYYDYKNLIIVVMLLGLFGFLDELSFGQRVFGFSVPHVLGVPLDAVHDLIRISVFAYEAHTYLILALVAVLLTAAIYISYRTSILGLRSLKKLRKDRPTFYILCFAGYVALAISIEEVFSEKLSRFTFLQAGEEIFELNAALALLFCCFSIRYSRRWFAAGLAVTGCTVVATALVPSHAAMWNVHTKAAYRAYMGNDISTAFDQYSAALEVAERLGEADSRVAESLTALGGLEIKRGRLERAEVLFSRALAVRDSALGPDHAAVASDLNNLAAVYQQLGRLGEAEPLYKRALAIWEANAVSHHRRIETVRMNLALVYKAQRRYVEARKELRPLAEKGYPNAQYSLALLYLKGWGVPRDLVQSYKWLELSRSLASSDAVRESSEKALKYLSTEMTSAEVEDAQRLIKAWWDSRATR